MIPPASQPAPGVPLEQPPVKKQKTSSTRGENFEITDRINLLAHQHLTTPLTPKNVQDALRDHYYFIREDLPEGSLNFINKEIVRGLILMAWKTKEKSFLLEALEFAKKEQLAIWTQETTTFLQRCYNLQELANLCIILGDKCFYVMKELLMLRCDNFEETFTLWTIDENLHHMDFTKYIDPSMYPAFATYMKSFYVSGSNDELNLPALQELLRIADFFCDENYGKQVDEKIYRKLSHKNQIAAMLQLLEYECLLSGSTADLLRKKIKQKINAKNCHKIYQNAHGLGCEELCFSVIECCIKKKLHKFPMFASTDGLLKKALYDYVEYDPMPILKRHVFLIPKNEFMEMTFSMINRFATQLNCHANFSSLYIAPHFPGDDELQCLGLFHNIKTLWLERVAFDQGLLHNLLHLPILQCLTISSCWRVNDEALQKIAEIKGLQELKLAYCYDLKSKDFEQLTKLEHLKRLEIENCPSFEDSALKTVSLLQNVVSLTLTKDPLNSWDGISDEGLSFLAKLPKLQTLNLTGWPKITEEKCQELLTNTPSLLAIRPKDCHRVRSQLFARVI